MIIIFSLVSCVVLNSKDTSSKKNGSNQTQNSKGISSNSAQQQQNSQGINNVASQLNDLNDLASTLDDLGDQDLTVPN